MSQNVLVPFDSSQPSKDALRYALETFPDAALTALYVIQPRRDPDLYHIQQAREEEAERAEDLLQSAVDAAGDRAIDTEIQVGKPDRIIIEYADENGFDLIVMGSHGRSGAARIVLGSVAERVVRNATLPVLVMR